MKKDELARRLARKTGVSRAEATDQLDRLVNDILKKIRGGQSATLPGFGCFRRDEEGGIQFLREKDIEKS